MGVPRDAHFSKAALLCPFLTKCSLLHFWAKNVPPRGNFKNFTRISREISTTRFARRFS